MSGRTSRWERKKNPGRLILQPRDREILLAAYGMRFVTREQIQRLLNWDCTRRVNLRLRKLYDHGYLSRSFLPTTRGSAKALYRLGSNGIPVITEALGYDPLVIKEKVRKTSQLKNLFLDHTLGMNEVRITFTQAIKSHPTLNMERWLSEDECQQDAYSGEDGQ